MVIIYLDPYADEIEFDDFKQEIKMEFDKHLNKKVIVKSNNLTWRNLQGNQEFILNDVQDIWQRLTGDYDFTFKVEKIKNNLYKTESHNHDGIENCIIEILEG